MLKAIRISITVLLISSTFAATATGTKEAAERCSEQIAQSRHLSSHDPVKALAIARNAIKLAETAGDERLELQALRTLAQVELRLNMANEFLKTTLQAIDVAGAVGDPRELSMVLRDLSTAYEMNLRADLAVEEAKRALAAVTPLNDPEETALAQLFLIRTMSNAGDLNGALALTDQMKTTCASSSDQLCAARVDLAIAQVLSHQKKYHDALPYITKAAKPILEVGGPGEKFDLLLDRIRIFTGIQMMQDAREAIDQAQALLKDLNDEKRSLQLDELKYQYALGMKRWQEALVLLQKMKRNDDSLKQAHVHLNMAGLQVAHQLESKESDNISLRRVNAEQEEKIQFQRTNSRILMAALGIMIVMATALFITRRKAIRLAGRLRRKSEVIKRQHAEIEARVLELERKNVRLAECIISEEGKELILKEIHHRVKNNLQVVESMINIQIGDIPDVRVQRLLRDAQGRIRSMAMVHEHIYRANGSNDMPLRSHLEKLGRSVLVAHGVHDRISILVDTSLPNFPVETLLPLSLLVNELMTNSIKHAFGENGHGSIRMSVKQHEIGYELRYGDDGTCVGSDGDASTRSFGHELITVLARQLNGKESWVRGAGVAFSLTFIPDKELLKMAS